MTDLPERGDRWLTRHEARIEDLMTWSRDEWATWLVDGLDIWFSAYDVGDRERAFAPVRILSEREIAPEAVARYLRLFFDRRLKASGATAMTDFNIRARIEGAVQHVCSNVALLRTADRAELILLVFRDLKARNLALITRRVLALLPRQQWLGPSGTRLLSLVSLIVRDTSALLEDEQLAAMFEGLLRRQDNFRPTLAYSLAMSPDDVAQAVDHFYQLSATLWEQEAAHGNADDIWRAVAKECSARFGRDIVAKAVYASRAASSEAGGTDYVDGMIPLARLEPFFMPGEPVEEAARGLFSARPQSSTRRRALARRGICAIPEMT